LDIAAGTPGSASPLLAFDRDHINDLLARLGQLEETLGASLPAKKMSAGVVGLEVPPERLLDLARALRDSLGFEMLTTVSAVDMVDHVESIYHFRSISNNWVVQVRVKLPSDHPEVDSLVGLYASANWLERECYDMVGIVYRGHPDLRRILLDDDFFGYPLRKSFHQTPLTVHDRATTQVDAVRALAGEQQRNVERVVPKRLGQGEQERLRPGVPTFGSNAFYLETGQGVEPDQPEHGYSVDTSENTGQAGQAQDQKLQRG
jgi:NADH/F420H2 dehydrogenase subunit C